MQHRSSPKLIAVMVVLAVGLLHAAGAATGHSVVWHGEPEPYENEFGNTWYSISVKAGTLDENGKLRVIATHGIEIPEGDIDFYFEVANRYISTAKPTGEAAKVFKVTGIYSQPVGGMTLTYYGIDLKNGGGGGGSLTGAPAKVYKSSSKIRKNIGRAIGIANASLALRKVRGIIKSLEKVEALLEKQAKKEKAPGATDTSGWLHPVMIKSPKKALSLAERAARTPEQKARDRTLEKAQTHIDKLNRKLEKLGN